MIVYRTTGPTLVIWESRDKKKFFIKHISIIITCSFRCALLFMLKAYIHVYSTSLDKGPNTRNPSDWQILTRQVEVQFRDSYLQVKRIYLQLSNHRCITLQGHLYNLMQRY